jgi:hypothetical protein
LGDAGGDLGLPRLAQHFLALLAWPQFLGLFPDPLSLFGEPWVWPGSRRPDEDGISNASSGYEARKRSQSGVSDAPDKSVDAAEQTSTLLESA